MTFQAVQFNGGECQELILMKRDNAYEYCLSAFREELLPHIFRSEEDQVARALEICTKELRDIYCSLACVERFGGVY